MSKRRLTPAEESYKAWIKSLPCILCELLAMRPEGPTDAHHIRADEGMGQRAGHFLLLPLCHSGCHQGPLGIHGDRTYFYIAKVSEWDLLNLVIEKHHALKRIH